MPVYVDEIFNYGWKLGPSCHLYADTAAELVNFAVGKMRMEPRWMQKSKKGVLHFDLTVRRRAEAVKLGAIEIGHEEALKIILKQLSPEWRERMKEMIKAQEC